jgi:hypothetical protein
MYHKIQDLSMLEKNDKARVPLRPAPYDIGLRLRLEAESSTPVMGLLGFIELLGLLGCLS